MFSVYKYGEGVGKYELSRRKKFNVSKENATQILNAVGTYFENNTINVFATDSGTWNLIITYEDGEHTYNGPFIHFGERGVPYPTLSVTYWELKNYMFLMVTVAQIELKK